MPLCEKVLVSADAATQNGIRDGALFRADRGDGEYDDERHRAEHEKAEEVAALSRRGDEHPGFLVDPHAIEQNAPGREYRHEHPQPVDPAVEGLPQIGLQHGPVRQEFVEFHRDDGGLGIHVGISI